LYGQVLQYGFLAHHPSAGLPSQGPLGSSFTLCLSLVRQSTDCQAPGPISFGLDPETLNEDLWMGLDGGLKKGSGRVAGVTTNSCCCSSGQTDKEILNGEETRRTGATRNAKKTRLATQTFYSHSIVLARPRAARPCRLIIVQSHHFVTTVLVLARPPGGDP